ncbi:YihY/virulence factor BrkB family protein [archaeon]|nr:YihY/virulence factor BrkB family protein [archaeon]
MESNDWPLADIYGFLVELIKYILIAGLFLLGLSIIYYFAPSKQSKWQFISIGSLVGTGLSLLTTFTFTIYVNNFDSYNKVYGSIGAIMALMVLLYINILSMIIGFELNTSIDKAELKKQLQQSKNQ